MRRRVRPPHRRCSPARAPSGRRPQLLRLWVGRHVNFWPMAPRPRGVYGRTVISALRSFLAEPAVRDPPRPRGRDRLLVAALLITGLLEVLLRDDVTWPGVALVAGV